jgi:hypothetical protein
MPLYLVRWPWLKASLVSARDEDELVDTLDQVADSEGASWSVYRGPVWVDFELPARFRIAVKKRGAPLSPEEVIVDDVSDVVDGGFRITSPPCDHTAEMDERITKKAFPNVYRAFWAGKHDPSDAEARAAVAADLIALSRAEWSRATRDRRSDEIGQIAKYVGAPTRQVENLLRARGQLPSKKPPRSPGLVSRLNKKRK